MPKRNANGDAVAASAIQPEQTVNLKFKSNDAEHELGLAESRTIESVKKELASLLSCKSDRIDLFFKSEPIKDIVKKSANTIAKSGFKNGDQVIVKLKQSMPEKVFTMEQYDKLTNYMNGLPAEIKRRQANEDVSRERILVDFALSTKDDGTLQTPYGQNGWLGFVTINERGQIRDGLNKLAPKQKYSFFHRLECTRLAICPFEARIPIDPKVSPCPAIFFGEHIHQLYSASAYNQQTGLLIELEQLLEAIIWLIEHGIDTADLLDDKKRTELLDQADEVTLERLKIVDEFLKVKADFVESDHYEKGNYASYSYFKAGTSVKSSLLEKVLNIFYIGMRTGTLGDRLVAIRKEIKKCAEHLIFAGSLKFTGVELVTGVSQPTAFNVEQYVMGCFSSGTTNRPCQLMNSTLITGKSHVVFEDPAKKRKLSAVLLASALLTVTTFEGKNYERSKKKSKLSNWFNVDLAQKEDNSRSKDASEDELRNYMIGHYAELLQSEDWKSNTLTAERKRSAELKAEIAELEAKLAMLGH